MRYTVLTPAFEQRLRDQAANGHEDPRMQRQAYDFLREREEERARKIYADPKFGKDMAGRHAKWAGALFVLSLLTGGLVSRASAWFGGSQMELALMYRYPVLRRRYSGWLQLLVVLGSTVGIVYGITYLCGLTR